MENDAAAKRRRQRLGAGLDRQIELSKEPGIVADAMKARLLDQAQDLLWDAWDNPDRKRRIRMAYRALEMTEDAADAYVILAMDEAETPERQAALYRQGVKAGKRALGKKYLTRYADSFWGDIETRPYMRAVHGLALTDREAGRLEEAAAGFAHLLELNPNDNQGVRYSQFTLLLEMHRDDEAVALATRYERDQGTEWEYSLALLAFRQQGATEKSLWALHLGMMTNRYVPPFLIGTKPLPAKRPTSYIEFGADEARLYALDAVRAWRSTPGALAWLADEDAKRKPWQQKKKPKQ